MSLQGKFDSMYYKNGKPIYVYNVTGTVKELEQFKAVQGVNYKENTKTGQPLFWVSGIVNGVRRLLAPVIDLAITGGDNPRVVYDDTKQQFNMMNKIHEALVPAIAAEMAKQWVTPAQAGGVQVTNPAAEVQAPVKVTENAAVAELEGEVAGGTENLDENKPV